MPGLTPLGIPYPLQGETVTDQSWQDLALAVEGLFTSLQTISDLADDFETAAIFGGSIAGVATGTTGTLTNFSSVTWDTSGWVNLGAFPSQITVPAGIYYAACTSSITGGTTYTFAQNHILNAGAVAGARTTDGSGLAFITLAASHAIIVATGATNAITMQGRWVGTGGPATFNFARLQVVKIRALADV